MFLRKNKLENVDGKWSHFSVSTKNGSPLIEALLLDLRKVFDYKFSQEQL